MQQRPARGGGGLVVPVHHHALACDVHGVVVDILLHVDDAAAQVPSVLRVLLLQQVLVHQVHDKQVAGLLNVGDAGFPEDFQQVDGADVDVAQAVVLGAVPEHAVYRRSVFQLLPPVVGVGLLELVVLQHNRQNGGEGLCALLVAALPGQHHRLRVIVHGVGVLVGDGIEQPGRRRLRPSARDLPGLAAVLPPDGFPVAQLPPQLVLYNAGLQVGLALLVSGQNVDGLCHLLLADALCALRLRQQHRSHLRRHGLVPLHTGQAVGLHAGDCLLFPSE